jgi:hypothetical protein
MNEILNGDPLLPRVYPQDVMIDELHSAGVPLRDDAVLRDVVKRDHVAVAVPDLVDVRLPVDGPVEDHPLPEAVGAVERVRLSEGSGERMLRNLVILAGGSGKARMIHAAHAMTVPLRCSGPAASR